MPSEIRLVKLTGFTSGEEWYKDLVGNFYAVYSSPFSEDNIHFGNSYLTYHGVGTTASTRIFSENLEILTEPFSSTELDAKQKEMGIDIEVDYSANI